MDFSKIDRDMIGNLSHNDPKLLKELGIKPLPDFSGLNKKDVNKKSKKTVPRSVYTEFIIWKIKEARKTNPKLTNKQYMKIAAKAWQPWKNTYVISEDDMEPDIEQIWDDYRNAYTTKSIENNSEDENNREDEDNSENKNNSEDEDNNSKKSKPPQNAYTQFIGPELKRQQELHPGLSQIKYMALCAQAWRDNKERLNQSH